MIFILYRLLSSLCEECTIGDTVELGDQTEAAELAGTVASAGAMAGETEGVGRWAQVLEGERT